MSIIIEFVNDLRVRYLAEAFKKKDFETKFWNPTTKPFFDVIYEENPTLIIAREETLKPEYRSEQYDIVILDDTLIPIECYNIDLLTEGYSNKSFSSEILYFSQEQLPNETLNLLYEISNNYHLRCIGNYPLPMTSYIGTVTTKELAFFLANAEYVLCHKNLLVAEAINCDAYPITTVENNLGIPVLRELSDIQPTTDIDIGNYTYEHLVEDIINGKAGIRF